MIQVPVERLRLPRVVITTSALQTRADSEEKKLRGKMLERKKAREEKGWSGKKKKAGEEK